MAPRKRSNVLALVILSLLVERPLHPYEMATVMRQRGLSSTVKLSFGALYANIETLQQLGLIVPVETRREGLHPERTIYAATEAGRAELLDWLRVLIRMPVTEYTQFVAGLALIAHLSPDEAVALLEERLHSLSEKIEMQRSEIETDTQRGVDQIFLIEDDYQLSQMECELAWIHKLIKEIRDGMLAEPFEGRLIWKVRRLDLAFETFEDGDGQRD